MKIIKCYRQYTYNNWFPGVRLLFLWNNSYWGVHLKSSKFFFEKLPITCMRRKSVKSVKISYQINICHIYGIFFATYMCIYCHHFHFAKN